VLLIPGWALTGAAGSAYLFLESMGPVQAGTGTGSWLSSAPPESPPAWTGLGSLSWFLFPAARLVLLSWAPVIIFLLARFVHMSHRPQWWPLMWFCAAIAGTALGVLAVFSYRLPAEVFSVAGPDGSAWTGYVRVPVINWYDIPAAIGFLILALVMWWTLIVPERPAARPSRGLLPALSFRHRSGNGARASGPPVALRRQPPSARTRWRATRGSPSPGSGLGR
jgi:hypothetical protein